MAEALGGAVELRPPDFGGAVLDFPELQEKFARMLVQSAAGLPAIAGRHRLDPA